MKKPHKLSIAFFPQKTGSVIATLAFAALPAITAAAPWEGPRLSESELRAKETASEHVGQSDIPPIPFATIASEGAYMSYALPHIEKSAQIATPNSSSSSDQPTFNPFFAASVVDTAVNDLGTTRSTVLAVAAIGFEVLSWATRDHSTDKQQEEMLRDIENLKHPSLWVVSVEGNPESPKTKPAENPGDYEARLQEIFLKAQTNLLSWPYKCDQAYFRSTNPFGMRKTWGKYVPGVSHARTFTCGHDSLDQSLALVLNEKVELITQRTTEGVWITRYLLPRLDRKTGIMKALNLPAGKENTAARELYKTLSPYLGKNHTAVFTAPYQDGEWRVFIANGGAEPVMY